MTLNEPVLSAMPDVNRNSPPNSSEEKLKTSLAYRSESGEEKQAATPDEIGTAEHRPRRGMIYDAPLGLKF